MPDCCLWRWLDRAASAWLERRLGPDTDEEPSLEYETSQFEEKCADYIEGNSYGVVLSDRTHAAAFFCQHRVH